MRKITVLSIAMAAIAMVSCQKPEIEQGNVSGKEMTFYASMDDTKAYIDGADVKWAATDEVAVYDGVCANVHVFTVKDGATTTTATLTGTVCEGATTFVAAYPASAAKGFADGKLTLAVPAAQTAGENGLDQAALLMTSQAAGNQFACKNVTGVLKVTVDVDNVNKIVISSNDQTSLAGNVTVNPATGGVVATTGGASELVLTPADDTFAQGDYYVAALPASVEGGITLKAYTSDSKVYAKKGSSALILGRSHLLPLGGLSGLTPKSVIATAAQFKAFLAAAASAEATDEFELANDITIVEGDYATAASFAGVLEGNGHKISGVDKTIFTVLSGKVQNLTLEGAVTITSGAEAYGVFANKTDKATIKAVNSYVNLTVNAGASLTIANLAAFVGQAFNSTLEGVHNYGNVTASASSYAVSTCGPGQTGVAGLAGLASGSTVKNCENHGAVSVTVDGIASSFMPNVGGAIGASNAGGGTFTNCDNSGAVTLTINTATSNQGVRMGGIAARNDKAVVTYCDNKADVTLNAPNFPKKVIEIAGISGGNGGTLANNTNSGTIKATAKNADYITLGGMAGHLYNATPITDCANNGALEAYVDISPSIFIGGASAYTDGAAPITRCSNNAPITYVGKEATNLKVGGVIGGRAEGGVVGIDLTNGANGDISLTCDKVATCWSGGVVYGTPKGGTNANYSNAGDLTVKIGTLTSGLLFGGCTGFALNAGTVISGTLENSGNIDVTIDTITATGTSAVGGIIGARWSNASVTATMTNTGTVTCNQASVKTGSEIGHVF